MDTIPECFYRVSVKALVLNETRDSFLVVQEDSGWWELPGGGLEWGESVHKGLSREIMEEMGILTTSIADNPSYFLTFENERKSAWIANVLYETKLKNLDFTSSSECINVAYINKETIEGMQLTMNVQKLLELFH